MIITLSSYIEGAFWKRLILVFEGLGYLPPDPDTPEGGAYVGNIIDQYRANFRSDEVMQIIEYARFNTLENLQYEKDHGWIDRAAVFGER